MTVTIFSAESVNLSFSMDLTNLPNCLLPAGIDARLDKLEMSIKADSKVALNLILSIDSQAPSGTYDLGVEIDQRFGDFVAGQCLPLRLIIP